MVATTTRHTSSLIKQLAADYPDITFRQSDDFMWSPTSKTVYFASDKTKSAAWSILHETSHAILGHTDYSSDIELLLKEVEAWQHASDILAPAYRLVVDPDHAQAQLDTYRDWLHQRSLCPRCSQSGLQTQTNRYSCINCSGSWRVNDARRCALKRYAL